MIASTVPPGRHDHRPGDTSSWLATADHHIQNIYTKLGISNRAAATRWAIEHGLVEAATLD
jgi:rRNA maturation endonuclease Nob1